jgi:pyruvate formate lyase activating enzyme
LLYISRHCRGCGNCIPACPVKAIGYTHDGLQVETNRSLCSNCGSCVAGCPNHAREIAGRHYTAEELFQEIGKDATYYRRSGGGVTVGGGESTLQADFIGEFLKICRDHYIHTVMETSAFVTWERLAPLLAHLDLLYVDLKQMDKKRHMELTGVPNHLILANVKRAAHVCPMIVRIPVIPGLNDSADNILATARFTRDLGDKVLRLELLPYHPFGIHSYGELGRNYALGEIQSPSDDHMEALRDIARSTGIQVEIGG